MVMSPPEHTQQPCSQSGRPMRVREAHENLVASRFNYFATWMTLIATTHKRRPQAQRFSILRKTSSGVIAHMTLLTARAIAGHSARLSKTCLFVTRSQSSAAFP